MNESTIDRQTGWQAGKQARRQAQNAEEKKCANIKEGREARKAGALPAIVHLSLG